MFESHSQHQEDQWIYDNLILPEKGFFIEVGAHDGISSSNTLAFEKMGWKGFLVEPDPFTYAQCVKNRINATWGCAIGEEVGDRPFNVNDQDHGLSGFNREGRVIEAMVMRLDDIWICYGAPHVHLLSIDTEGTELEVWKSRGHMKPDVVIIEHNTLGLPLKDNEILEQFTRDGYALVHKTPINMIFTHGNLRR